MTSNRYFGDRAFYRRLFGVAVPIMIQQGITNFVGMLDNIMVGRLGTDPMSGVSIVNQLMFVFNLCIFGGLSGIGIFTAQFYGKNDQEGVRYTFRMQLLLSFLLTALATVIFLLFSDNLISLYLHEGGNGGDIAETFRQARLYERAMLAGMLPFAVTQVYSSTLRNTGETIVPMRAGIAAVAVNLVGNYILIFGKFGFPRLGVTGAAAATVLSRFAELAIVAVWTHRHAIRNPYIVGAWRHLFTFPAALCRKIFVKALPLLVNETLWSSGMAALNQRYSTRGLSAVAAMNISSTISNVFNISFIAMGSAIAIILGQLLGAGKIRQAKEDATRLAVASILLCAATGALLFAVSGLFPRIYNTSDEIRQLAAGVIRVFAICMPIHAYVNAAYFTIRSGGKTFITFLFDSCFLWVICVPVASVLAYFTSLPVVWMAFVVESLNLIKCVTGYFMIRSGVWAQDLTRY